MAARSRLITAILAFVFIASAQSSRADPGQVYLVQASGWMDGYINNTRGEFQRKVARLIELTHAEGWPIAVASFNRQKEAMERGDDCSPRTLFPTDSCVEASTLAQWNGRGVEEALARIRIPGNPNGSLANAFIDEALSRARDIHLGRAPNGIVWLITNNKNAPVGGVPLREVVENTKSFMAELKNAPDITAVVAVPIEMRAVSADHPQFGTQFGFIAYGVAYGPQGKALLEAVTWNPPFVAEFGQPFRIRPLDDAPLRLTIAPQTVDGSISVGSGRDGTIHVTGVEIGRSAPLVLRGGLENTLYPYVIRKATVRLYWRPRATNPVGRLLITVDRKTITDIGPRETRAVTVELGFEADRAPIERKKIKDQVFEETGDLHLEVTDIELSHDPAAVARLKKVFLGDTVDPATRSALETQIPDILLWGTTLARSDGKVPIVFEARVSPFDTVLAVAAAIVALVFAGLLYMQLTSARRQSVVIAGQRQFFSLRPFQTVPFKAIDGQDYIVRGGLFGTKSARATPTGGTRT